MHKQRTAYFLFSILAAIFIWSGQVVAAESIPGEYLVKYKGQSFVPIASVRSIANVRLMDHNPYGQILKIKVAEQDVATTLVNVLNDPNVEYVVPNIKLRAFEAPVSTQALKEQWAMKKVNAEAAWAKAGNRGKRSIVVAVIDTGVDYNHASLKPNMVAGYDFRENDSDPMDKTSSQNPGHGTHCAGIVGATGLIDGGVVGMSPEVSLMPLRFLGEDGSGDLNSGIKAIDYAIQNKAHVISASWGATVARSQAMPLVEAVQRASDAGVIVVMAAANDGRNNDKTEVFPTNASFKNTISVAASGDKDEKPSWSNYGKRTVSMAAPGLNIMSTLPGNKYQNLSGTSMATPLVSGMVAFMLSQDPTLTGEQVRSILQHTGSKVEIETACNCRIDALGAITTVLEKKMYIAPATAALGIGETMTFTAPNGRAPFTFAVANESVGSIANDGIFTAKAEGSTTVTVTDAEGKKSTSLNVLVGAQSSSQPQPPGGGGECPLGDQQLCDILCQVQPQLPFCNQ